MASKVLGFWVSWVVASSVTSGVAFVVTLIPAGFVGFLAGGAASSSVGLAIGAAIIGVGIGTVTGAAQAQLLPWAREVRMRWLLRSIVGWMGGAALGCLVAVGTEALREGAGESKGLLTSTSLLIETATPIAGLVLGIVLRPVPPSVAPGSLPEWLVAHTAAVSGGWIVGRLLFGNGALLGLSYSSLVVGPLCYGIISGLIMLTVVDRRPAEPTDPLVEADIG